MALRWIDSFDHYATADIDAKYERRGGSPSISTGRNGNGLVCTDANTNPIVRKVFADNQSTLIVGFALNIATFSGANKEIANIFDTNGVNHAAMGYIDATKVLYLSGAWGTSSGTTVLTPATWYYVEIKITVANSGGSYEWRINNNVEGSASGIDTNNGGVDSACQVELRAGGSASTSRTRTFDDFYICDGTGSSPYNDFLGDVRVEAIFPSGDGNTSNLVGSDGNSTNNSLLVDETTPNTTDYVESATAGDKDTYAMGNVTPTSGTVFGVQPVPYSLKTNAGSRSIKSVARLSGTEEDSAGTPLGSDYLIMPDIRTTKPGGGAWTISDVNSAEFGVKVA